MKKIIFIMFVSTAIANATVYNIQGAPAIRMMNALIAGGVPVNDVTALVPHPMNVIEVYEMKPNNVLCHGSRFIHVQNTGDTTDDFSEIQTLRGCAYNVPTEYNIGEDGAPNGIRLLNDMSPALEGLDGVFGDGGMGKWDEGIANATCSMVKKMEGTTTSNSYVCEYSDWDISAKKL